MKKIFLIGLVLLVAGYVYAEVPCKINYQGRLIENNVPVNGPVNMEFKLYNQATGGSLLKTITINNVQVYNGLFRAVLDLEGVDWTAGKTIYLEVKAGTDTLSPREPIYAYPYAINTHFLEGKTTAHFLDVAGSTQTKQGGLNIMGNVGIGTPGPGQKLEVAGDGKFTGGDMAVWYGNKAVTIRQDSSNTYIANMANFVANGAESNGLLILNGAQGIKLKYGETGSTGSDGLILDSSGNVGIGTTNPGAKLDVAGMIGTQGGDGVGLKMLNTNTNTFYGVGAWGNRLEWYRNQGENYYWAMLTSQDGKWRFGGYADSAGPLLQVIGDTYISGNVGIGTTGPTAKLHIGGTAGVDGIRFPDGTLMTTAAAIGTVANVVMVQTRTQATYSAPISGNGTIITPLNLVITPKKAGNRIILEWIVNGEMYHNTVYIVTRNGVLLADTTNAANNRWAGITAQPYDGDTASTPDNAVVKIIDMNSLDVATTYELRVRSSDGAIRTLSLNRTAASAGQDGYEAGLSVGTATEIWQ